MTDIKLKPGIIRECLGGSKWVIVSPKSFRWLDGTYIMNCPAASLAADPSEVIGLLPPDELDADSWCERFALPYPCIKNAKQYVPFWDDIDSRWFSRHVSSGCLYDMNGCSPPVEVPVVKDEPIQTRGDPMTYIDKLKPGIIRKCIGATDNQKWVVIDSTHWRHMDGEGASECVTMSDDPSTVVGLLPDLELDSTDWCERYKLPDPCIHNAKEYEPLWDGAYADGVGRWISRYLDNGNLYDSDGCQVVVKKDPPVTQSVNPTQQPSKPDIDKLKPQFELLPGIIRQCTTVDKKWVVIDSMHWRWMDHKYVSESTSPSTLSDNPSNVVGLLPRGELDSTVWREAYVLPTPCICNAGEYQPHWDEASAAWFSRHLDSGHLYDMDGTRQPPQPSKPAQPPQPALAAVVRFFKKYW